MSIYIKPNNTDNPLTVHACKNGGTWEFIKVKGSGKDRKQMTLWVHNKPSGLEVGDQFLVTGILDAKYKSVKDKQGNWQDEYSLTVDVKPFSGASAPKSDFYDLPSDGDDEGLPF